MADCPTNGHDWKQKETIVIAVDASVVKTRKLRYRMAMTQLSKMYRIPDTGEKYVMYLSSYPVSSTRDWKLQNRYVENYVEYFIYINIKETDNALID